MDPADHVLTIINSSKGVRCYHLTIEHAVSGRNGKQLTMGKARTENGKEVSCVTLVLLLRSETTVDVCKIQLGVDIPVTQTRISSDIIDWKPHPCPHLRESVHCAEVFPLGGQGPYLCTQGFGGGLTHFAHPSTYHALDFRCPVGTPILAVGSGVVTEVRETCLSTGIHVSNFFQWNGITLMIDSIEEATQRKEVCRNHVVEYVHIQVSFIAFI